MNNKFTVLRHLNIHCFGTMVWKVNVNNIEQVSTFTGKIIVLAWSHENDKSYKIISTSVMIKGVPWNILGTIYIFSLLSTLQPQPRIQSPWDQSSCHSKTCSKSLPPSHTGSRSPASCCRCCRWSRTCARPSPPPASAQRWKLIYHIADKYLLRPI